MTRFHALSIRRILKSEFHTLYIIQRVKIRPYGWISPSATGKMIGVRALTTLDSQAHSSSHHEHPACLKMCKLGFNVYPTCSFIVWQQGLCSSVSSVLP